MLLALLVCIHFSPLCTSVVSLCFAFHALMLIFLFSFRWNVTKSTVFLTAVFRFTFHLFVGIAVKFPSSDYLCIPQPLSQRNKKFKLNQHYTLKQHVANKQQQCIQYCKHTSVLTIVIFVLIMMILRFHNFPNSLCHCVKYADLLSTHVQFSFAFYQESWTLWIAIEGATIGNWWVCEMSETSQLVLPLFQLPIVAPPIGETCNPQCSTLLLFIPSDFCLLLASINRLTQWNSWSYRKSMWWI